MTLHEVVATIMTLDRNDPDFELKITGIIKRHVHHEKEFLAFRTLLHNDCWPTSKRRRIRKKWYGHRLRWMVEELRTRYESHKQWGSLPDEQVVTWSVGRHVFKDGKLRLKDDAS
jgi:hypothetical protein